MPKLDPLKDEIIDVPGSFSCMISARYILREGEAPLNAGIASIVYPSYTVDWTKDDAYTRAVDQAVEGVFNRIQADPIMQGLLEKDWWTTFDRKLWEMKATEMLSGTLCSQTAGGNLVQYRNDWLQDGVSRPASLNALSSDIENNTQHIENDCDTMAITQAVILQRVEERFLPIRDESMDPDNHKCQGTYYVCYGRVASRIFSQAEKKDILRAIDADFADSASESRDEAKARFSAMAAAGYQEKSRHAFTMSSETGGCIEPTNINYINPLNIDPVGDFIKGTPVVLDSGFSAYKADSTTFSKADIGSENLIEGPNKREEFNNELRLFEMQNMYDAFKKGLSRELETFSKACTKVSGDPRMEVLGDLFCTMRTRGLDADSFAMMQDLLSHYDVRSALIELQSGTRVSQYLVQMYETYPDRQFLYNEEIEASIEVSRSIRPPIYDNIPIYFLPFQDNKNYIDYLTQLTPTEADFPLRIDFKSAGDEMNDALNKIESGLNQPSAVVEANLDMKITETQAKPSAP